MLEFIGMVLTVGFLGACVGACVGACLGLGEALIRGLTRSSKADKLERRATHGRKRRKEQTEGEDHPVSNR